MPAKKTTIATAEKRVIKAEISTLRKSLRKIVADEAAEGRRVNREIAKLYKYLDRSAGACNRETASINRRIAILEGRLNS